jgi:hypothetical protein
MKAATLESIARSFRRLGWLGFWIQIVVGALPLAMLVYVAVNKVAGGSLTLEIMDYLALAGLIILAFTALWSYRYTRLGKQIADSNRCPTWEAVVKTLWVGLWAGIVGISMSVLLLVVEVVRLLILFLKAPQAGVPVIRTEADQRTAWVSAIDVVSLLADLCTLIGELVVIAITLWLLFRITRSINLFRHSSGTTES